MIPKTKQALRIDFRGFFEEVFKNTRSDEKNDMI